MLTRYCDWRSVAGTVSLSYFYERRWCQNKYMPFLQPVLQFVACVTTVFFCFCRRTCRPTHIRKFVRISQSDVMPANIHCEQTWSRSAMHVADKEKRCLNKLQNAHFCLTMSTLYAPVRFKRCVVGFRPGHRRHMRGITSMFSVTSVLSERTD